MARLRRPESAPGADPVVPDELKDFRHPVWKSAEDTAAWYRHHGLGVPVSTAFWTRRRGDAERAWAVRHGFMSTQHPETPDHARLRELGLSRVSSLERAAWRASEL